jgi:hypothetical protein
MIALALGLLSCVGSEEPDRPPDLPDECVLPAGLDSADTAGIPDSGHSSEDWIAGCEVVEVPDLVTSREVLLALVDPGAVRLCCSLQSDPSEVHVVNSPQGTEHRLTLHGLLAESNYECVAEVTQATEDREIALTFSTDALPDWVRLPELSGDPDASWGAYTVLNHFVNGKAIDDQKLLVFDKHGRVRWYLDLRDDITAVDVSYLGDGTFLYGGGFGGPPRIVDLFGAELFLGNDPVAGVSHHHDVEMLPSGRIASLVTTRDQFDGEEWTGFGVEIIEVPSGLVVWSFDSQTAVDAGDLSPGKGDPWHANALQVVEDDGMLQDVYVNLRDINLFVRIDPETQRITSRLGPDGDYQLVDASGDAADESDWFYWPHAPEVAGDRILFYDNRNPRPDSETSRAVELSLDHQAMTAQVTWQWTERNFREQAWGDVDYLPSGNVLVGIAHCDVCDLSDNRSRSAVVEVDRESGDVLWRLTWPEATDGIYRAERVRGCDLFLNALYCPKLLDE